jgi:precorrin-2 dehydrogenase/sirohydrochlorin ferrochelatase
LREFFEEIIPEDISQMVLNLEYRKTLKGDFEEKSENESYRIAKNKKRN